MAGGGFLNFVFMIIAVLNQHSDARCALGHRGLFSEQGLGKMESIADFPSTSNDFRAHSMTFFDLISSIHL
jgi:hypothetical protein